MPSSPLRQSASGTADSSGCTITFAAPPLTRVWTGSVMIPSSPITTAWTITVGGFPWGTMTGPGPYNVQALPGEQLKLVATSGVTSGDTYTASFIGSDDPRDAAMYVFPISPSGAASSGSAPLPSGNSIFRGEGSGTSGSTASTSFTIGNLVAGDTLVLATSAAGSSVATPSASGVSFTLITYATLNSYTVAVYTATVPTEVTSLPITLSVNGYGAWISATSLKGIVSGTPGSTGASSGVNDLGADITIPSLGVAFWAAAGGDGYFTGPAGPAGPTFAVMSNYAALGVILNTTGSSNSFSLLAFYSYATSGVTAYGAMT